MSKPINKWEKPFHVERGDVYMGAVNLDSDPQKGIQRGYRPLLVTQSDWQNRKSESVIVVPGTSELKKTGMCTHVVMHAAAGHHEEDNQSLQTGRTRCEDQMQETEKIAKVFHFSTLSF